MASPKSNTSTIDATAEKVAAELSNLLSTKAVSKGSINIAAEFERIARANGNVVTFAQAKELCPKAPSDACYYFRQALGKAVTVRGKDGKTQWEVMKLSNGKFGYPSEVKALVAELQALAAK